MSARSKKPEVVEAGLQLLLKLIAEGGEFPDAAWTAAQKSGGDQTLIDDATTVVEIKDGVKGNYPMRNIGAMLPIKFEDGTPLTRTDGWVRPTPKPTKKIVAQTTRMFQVVLYEDGTADLCGFTFRDHPTMKIIGDGTLQNPLEIVPK